MAPQNRTPYVPGFKEVAKKVRLAIEALENGYYEIIDENQAPRTFASLGIRTDEALLEHVLEFLDEILALDAFACFCGIGGRVEFCTKPRFLDVRLYAFSWHSPKMGKRMYLKFGLREKGAKSVFTYMHLSCHDDE